MLFPERLKRLAILNVPHPSIMRDELNRRNWQQILKSWYIAYFQIPYLPEWGMSMNDYDLLVRALEESGKEGSFEPAEFEEYKRAWSQPNALRSMVNWYRAAAIPTGGGSQNERKIQINPKTLILWGEQDKFLGKELAEQSLAICHDARAIFYPNATHWLQVDEADAVNQELANFFGE